VFKQVSRVELSLNIDLLGNFAETEESRSDLRAASKRRFKDLTPPVTEAAGHRAITQFKLTDGSTGGKIHRNFLVLITPS
jgi:hypothetical protein